MIKTYNPTPEIAVPRLSLARLPTPVQALAGLPGLADGPEMFIKRDDLTGSALSGNKVRKLEFLMAEALDRGADTVITCGGIQSNHARATALAAAKLGLACRLILKDGGSTQGAGSAQGAVEGNLFLDLLAGAEVERITVEAYADRDRLMEEAAAGLRAQGRTPYVIPEGGSNALGTCGYAAAVSEIARDDDVGGAGFDFVVTALGSGGTCCGLEIGRAFTGMSFRVLAVNVLESAAAFRPRIEAIFDEFAGRFGTPPGAAPDNIEIVEGYEGPDYAVSWPEERDLIRETARSTGIVLDPVYTGKAFFGLMDQVRRGRFAAGDRILFLHTGGIYGLLAQAETFGLKM